MGRKAETPLEAIAGFLILMAAFAVFFWLLERRYPGVRELPARRPGELRSDLSYWILGFALDRTVLPVIGFLPILAFAAMGLPRLDTVVSQQPLALQVAEALVLLDLTTYAIHRLQHTWRPLWRLHALHHSSGHLDWIAGARSHPLEAAISRALGIGPLYFAGFDPAVYAALGPVFGLLGILLHANLRWDFGPLRWWIASPAYHRWHHSTAPEAVDRNFAALFPWIDRMFGTAYFPEDRQPAEFGLAGGQGAPDGFWRQLRWPFRNIR